VDRRRSDRTAWRLALEGTYFRPGEGCRNAGPCDGGAASVIAGLSGGLVLASSRVDAGPYVTGRFGLYLVDTDMMPRPGGYAGVGVAVPMPAGAFTLELGVHGYPSPTVHTWMAPLRLGMRWRL
jgi:hypothetical protein